MADDLPPVIVLALGAAAVGGPEALALLRDVAGRSPAADVIVVAFLIGAATSLVLGTMLLARYIRVADASRDAAHLLQQATARFARVTLAVALVVAVFVAACLLTVPSSVSTGATRGLGGAAGSCSAR